MVFAALPCRWLQDVMAFWQTIASYALSSCHNVFDHRTKGVCLEGLKRRADQVCADAAAAAAAACIHMHLCCVHGTEWTVPGERQARQRLAEVLGERPHAA